MIGKTINYIENKAKVSRHVDAEEYQHGKRIYIMHDPSDPQKEERTALADDFDARFKTTGKVNKRRGFNAKYRERRPDR